MSEVLDQAEINALLNAAGVPPPAAPSASGASPAARRAPQETIWLRPDAPSYDFRRPERVSKDQIRTLASVHEVFARNFSAMLSSYLRTIIDVRVVAVEQLTYNEFVHSLPNPTCFLTLEAPPLEGQMCLELSPLIVYPIIDRLLGGNSSSAYIPQRALTVIEWRLITKIVERALENLSEVWKNLVDARFAVVSGESNPELVHIVAPTEVVVFITFEIKLGTNAGTMSLCIPFNTIESVVSRLATQAWFYKPKPANDRQARRLHRGLVRGTVPLTGFLGQTTIRMGELRALEVGDLLVLDKRASQEFILRIGDRNKFAGTLGQVRGLRALRITREAIPDEPL
jgi:flagellar motor switch protein FliM